MTLVILCVKVMSQITSSGVSSTLLQMRFLRFPRTEQNGVDSPAFIDLRNSNSLELC